MESEFKVESIQRSFGGFNFATLYYNIIDPKPIEYISLLGSDERFIYTIGPLPSYYVYSYSFDLNTKVLTLRKNDEVYLTL